MKKTLVATIMAVGLMSMTANASELKTENCVITGLDTETDTLLLESPDGNVFEFEGIEDWMDNDIARVEFDTKGTVDRTDDEIISMTYIGYLL